jgi:multidrug efflux pump subunit AcrA (membrane-fusion protein)
MSDEAELTPKTYVDEPPRTYSGALLAAIAVALLLGIGGLIWSYTLSGKVGAQQQELADAKAQNVKLDAQLRETDERLNVATDELKTSLGLTQKQLDTRAQELQVREAREEAASARLASEQKQTAQQVTAVSSAVSDVKTDVGGVKTDVAKTQSDLATAVTQLTSMRGDLNGHSSLIARNAEELEVLKHKGDRNYYEFTLDKGAGAKNVGTIKIDLKKVDNKRSKFTLVVSSDDRSIEKKDRTLDEPIQFYSGKTPALFEIVVNNIGKKTVSGYLSTPKSSPEPMPAPSAGR